MCAGTGLSKEQKVGPTLQKRRATGRGRTSQQEAEHNSEWFSLRARMPLPSRTRSISAPPCVPHGAPIAEGTNFASGHYGANKSISGSWRLECVRAFQSSVRRLVGDTLATRAHHGILLRGHALLDAAQPGRRHMTPFARTEGLAALHTMSRAWHIGVAGDSLCMTPAFGSHLTLPI